MLLEPRWDEEQFVLAKQRIINGLKRNMANPSYLASSTLDKLIYGDNHILAYDQQGTEASVEAMTIDDLKSITMTHIVSPSTARFLVAGNLTKEKVTAALASLTQNWEAKEVVIPAVPQVVAPEKSMIFFVDVPGAKQSVSE